MKVTISLQTNIELFCSAPPLQATSLGLGLPGLQTELSALPCFPTVYPRVQTLPSYKTLLWDEFFLPNSHSAALVPPNVLFLEKWPLKEWFCEKQVFGGRP